MSRKAPAVQLYAGDFLTGTTLMTNEEVGLYIRLLCLQVEHGSVPDDVERIAAVYGPSSRKIWPGVRGKFVAGTEAGTMINERMAEVMAIRDAFRKRQSERGKASAEVRFNRGSTKRKRPLGSTVVEPVGDGDSITTISGKERAGELQWPAFAGVKCKTKWADFLAYRLKEHGKRYKSVESEQRQLNLAAKYFPSGPQFVAGLDHTMDKNWQFPVDPAEHTYPAVAEAPSTLIEYRL